VSRGAGRVERAIRELFVASPDRDGDEAVAAPLRLEAEQKSAALTAELHAAVALRNRYTLAGMFRNSLLVGSELLTVAADLHELAKQNDPDVVREGLRAARQQARRIGRAMRLSVVDATHGLASATRTADRALSIHRLRLVEVIQPPIAGLEFEKATLGQTGRCYVGKKSAASCEGSKIHSTAGSIFGKSQFRINDPFFR
jgi:hypothetical protein